MTSGLGGGAPRSVVAFFEDRLDAWRTGTREGQGYVFTLLAAASLLIFTVSFFSPITLPVSLFAIPLVIGGLTMHARPLAWLVGVEGVLVLISLALTSHVTSWAFQQSINVTVVAVVALIVVVWGRGNRSGLLGRLGESMLMELNQRLRAQGVVPRLPEGWSTESVLRSAGGAKFAGDFFIAHLHEDGDTLEIVLVDVSGKGVGAGTKSLQFSGALGGLIGTMAPVELFDAANEFLLRQDWVFSFATAVNVRVDLRTGAFLITSAGHPPVLRWNRVWSTWDLDDARGMALGIVKDPQFRQSKGVIGPGEALMLYTDGVVESRDHDVDAGVDFLRTSAAQQVRDGFAGAAERIVDAIEGDDDDRAVLILYREKA
ncbi:MAG TPA: PP2C family protein-serine/threonine phosphatase [Aeromicrobium sp.]|nr:PP2C family protein-serine/threonine phosphatase [Aeromicrobium sp.]